MCCKTAIQARKDACKLQHLPYSLALMSTHTFLWHDYETFGCSRAVTVGPVCGDRTDAELNEIGEPIML